MSPVASWVFVALAVAPVLVCCWLLWPASSSRPRASSDSSAARRDGATNPTGRRAGADTGDPDPQTGSDSPHGAAPTVLTPCPGCGHPEALALDDALVCLRCASVWQQEEAR